MDDQRAVHHQRGAAEAVGRRASTQVASQVNRPDRLPVRGVEGEQPAPGLERHHQVPVHCRRRDRSIPRAIAAGIGRGDAAPPPFLSGRRVEGDDVLIAVLEHRDCLAFGDDHTGVSEAHPGPPDDRGCQARGADHAGHDPRPGAAPERGPALVLCRRVSGTGQGGGGGGESETGAKERREHGGPSGPSATDGTDGTARHLPRLP